MLHLDCPIIACALPSGEQSGCIQSSNIHYLSTNAQNKRKQTKMLLKASESKIVFFINYKSNQP